MYGMASWVAGTRVYVGVHYPTDVVGGAGLGLALGALWRGPFARVARWLVG
jgi:membrane-associated phospholipid phosphatase